jgi:hypothetical protein
MKQLKKNLALILALGLTVGVDLWATAPRAQTQGAVFVSPPARRTLFVKAGTEKLALEAPVGMCFVDRTSPIQEATYDVLSGIVERNGDQSVLGVFMGCDQVGDSSAWENGMPTFGFVTWLNPFIGRTIKMSRGDYLDMREAFFHDYAKMKAGFAMAADGKVHRNADNVSLHLTGNEGLAGMQRKGAIVIATTTVKHVPLEFTLHYAAQGDLGQVPPPPASELYALMDKLVAQQIALNN